MLCFIDSFVGCHLGVMLRSDRSSLCDCISHGKIWAAENLASYDFGDCRISPRPCLLYCLDGYREVSRSRHAATFPGFHPNWRFRDANMANRNLELFTSVLCWP